MSETCARKPDPTPAPDVAPALEPVLAPVRDDLARMKELYRTYLLPDGDNDTLQSAPPAVRDAIARFCVPLAENMSQQLGRMEGKWLRAAMTLLAGSLREPAAERVIQTAAAMELIHVATLVHDDIIDGALLRRGVTALHRSHGANAAVLMGDYLFAKAFQLLTLTESTRLLSGIARRTTAVCLGEIQDSVSSGNLALTEEDYLSLVTFKTASLFAACNWAGGLLAGLPDETCDALDRYGMAFGIAFQVRDDVLDYVAATDERGKPVFADFDHGKATLPLIHLRERLLATGRRAEWERLPTLPPAAVVALLQTEGCLASAWQVCEDYAARATAELDQLAAQGYRCAPVDALRSVCTFVATRRH